MAKWNDEVDIMHRREVEMLEAEEDARAQRRYEAWKKRHEVAQAAAGVTPDGAGQTQAGVAADPA